MSFVEAKIIGFFLDLVLRTQRILSKTINGRGKSVKLIAKLIQLHKVLFAAAMLATCFSVWMNLCWNNFLAYFIDSLSSVSSLKNTSSETPLLHLLLLAIFIIVAITVSEYVASFMASYTCEYLAHEIRMGYVRSYLHMDIRTLSKLNVGEEQSAMQNELSEISAYMNENLFSFTKQLLSFGFTVVFLIWQSPKLAVLSIFPVIPVVGYCAFSSKMIKKYTEQCQESKKKMNGLSGILLELFPIIQVYDAYNLFTAVMNESLIEWQNASTKKERVAAGLMSLSGLLSFIPLLLLLGIGGVMVMKGEITIGVFYIFINLSGHVSGFLQNMPNIYAGFRRFCAAVGRLESKLILKAR